MSIGVVLLCRYNSTRLPGKILLPIEGKPMLDHIVDRCAHAGLPVAVATSNELSDEPIAAHCKANSFDLFRGSLNNVAQRFLSCAEERHWTYAARINGDNLFANHEVLSQLSEIARSGQYDFLTNVPERTYPPGTSVEIVKTRFYREQLANFQEDGHFEHVTSFFYSQREIKQFTLRNTEAHKWAGVNLAVDTLGDYQQAQKIARALTMPIRVATLNDIREVL